MKTMWLAFKRVAPILLFGVLPVLVLATAAYVYHHNDNLGNDFQGEFYPEAKLVLHWTNPFPAAHSDLSSGENRIFPIPGALLIGPLTVLSEPWAAVVFVALLLAALLATLWLLGVRDWRVYGLVAIWPQSIAAMQTGNLTILLGLLVAVAWRFRRHAWVPGIAIGCAIALKLFLWPLLIWLLAVRRYRSASTAAALGFVGGFLLVLPFISLHHYLQLLRGMGSTFGPESYNVIGLLTQSDLASKKVALVVAYLVGGVLLVLAYRRRSLPLAVSASLVLSPIVWVHYFVLLVIPIAIRWPRLSATWFVPMVMWVLPGNGYNVRLRHVVVALVVFAAVTALVEWWPRGYSLARRRQLEGQAASPVR
jgi:hypothetical protein